jgi:PEP-CTERM motif
MKRLLAWVGIVLFLAVGQASANIVYTFSGVTFSDGGTLTGTFTTNDTFNALIDFNITTSAGVGIGFNYTPGTATSLSSLPAILVFDSPGPADILQVTFSGGLTATGASILSDTWDSFEQTTAPARRDITAGSAIVATSVPEPATIGLLGIGVLGLLISVRRRRQA